MTILKISYLQDSEGKHNYKLYKDDKLIARGTSEHDNILEMFFARYTPMVVYGNFN